MRQAHPPVQERADQIKQRLDEMPDGRLAGAPAAAALGPLAAPMVVAPAVAFAARSAVPIVLAGVLAYDATQRVFLTYVLTNPTTGQVYIGRTSGYGTPESILARRHAAHVILRARGFTMRRVDVAGQGWDASPAVRGREQQLMDFYGGVGSPGVANAIRGVSKINPGGRLFHTLSDANFGNIAPYTGL
jgi:hypothetical protein